MQSKIQPTVPSPPQAKTRKSGVSRKKFSLGSRRKAKMVSLTLLRLTFDTPKSKFPMAPSTPSLGVCYDLDSFWGWKGDLIFWNQNLLSNGIECESQEPSSFEENLTQHSTQKMVFQKLSIICAEESIVCLLCNNMTHSQYFNSPSALLPALSLQSHLKSDVLN